MFDKAPPGFEKNQYIPGRKHKPTYKPKPPKVVRTKYTGFNKYGINSSITFNEYIELRKTDGFKLWWKKQFHKQLGLCYYCLADLRTKFINVEHIVPMSRGGKNRKSNMVLACSECNKEKGSTLLKFKERQRLKRDCKERLIKHKRGAT